MVSRQRVPTAADVARLAGVHASTVSRSLDPRKRGQVKAATRERVVLAAATLGYHPNLVASSLRRRQSNTIGVLISSFSNPIYGELLHGISGELERLGYHLLITEVPDDADGDRLSDAIDMMRARGIDGLICASARGRDAAILRSLAESGMPVILCLRWIEATGIPRVVNDDARGGALAARHLLELGHERILEIAGPTDISTFAERARGFREVLAESPGSILYTTVRSATPSVEEGYRVMAGILASGAPFDASAVFAHNDLLAVGAIDALADVGIECPRQVSVVGYNDNPLTGHLQPGLTTIRLQIDRMGKEAARAVLAVVAERNPVEFVISLQPELIVRESTITPADARSTARVEQDLPLDPA
ncbi:LacI family DNA-binding transcriptional regulator [Cryobacterium psychrophilum]|uniref:LacI family transcriptional regulator n=1 Tax=Cryobacterium psychrophilum TaxID=41988 RepID=A0A4Y8KSD8_9MICO|nr:LacI family DNA-binding transcriptional regulator [Cryobacterium psychrophilum]TDW29510.1 LacI family transcriptional regulator [Cryobacterium psychrophilum]TFD81644.1 LacI family transcriptional regulator [Cryobacterium psychrophilum]